LPRIHLEKTLEQLEQLFGMAAGINLSDGLSDVAVFVNYIGDTFRIRGIGRIARAVGETDASIGVTE
jgi:hypothetical protein